MKKILIRQTLRQTLNLVLSLTLSLTLSLNHNIVAQETRETETYVIGIGDQLDIYVYPGEEFSKLVIVGDDGEMTTPIIGKMKVSGLTVKQLTDNLTKEIKRYVANPQVTITVRKYGKPSQIYLAGQVLRPGTYPYRDGLMLLELISIAGGPAERANIENIKITRGAERKVIYVDMSKDTELEPGDLVEIMKLEAISPIQIHGQVKNPGNYSYRKGIKLLEVITLAGGFGDNANLRNIKVHRADSQNNTVKVDVEEILVKGKLEKDILLQGGDIVYVPKSGVAWWNWFLTNVMPTLTLISALVLLFRTT